MWSPYRGSLRFHREQRVRVDLLPKLVPRVGGRQCLRVLLGVQTFVDQLPFPVVGACVAQAMK